MTNLVMLRDAHVEISPNRDSSTGFLNSIGIQIEKDGVIVNHEFDHRSSEVHDLNRSDIKTFSKALNGGTFAIADGKLVDYRRSDFTGFIHSDANIENLSNELGCNSLKSGQYSSGVNGMFLSSRANAKSDFFLGGVHDTFSMQVDSLAEGGEFDLNMIYKWNPFNKNVSTSLEVLRLVCQNGMVARASFIENQVPIINLIRENLAITFESRRDDIVNKLGMRYEQMADTQCTMYQLQRALDVIESRNNELYIPNEAGQLILPDDLSTQSKRLKSLADVVDPSLHLSKYVNVDSIGVDQAKKVNGHISQFDLLNVITEAGSHTPNGSNNDAEINMLANSIMFDELNQGKRISRSSPERKNHNHKIAFFGTNEEEVALA